MHRLNITDILTALRHADPYVLAAAIYADNDPRLLDALAQTLSGAADRAASHPYPEVLRCPVADALPPGHALPTATELTAASSPGTPPFIGNDHGLRSRVMSSSPMTVVPGWLDRMDADPPLTGILDARIDYLRAAVSAMGRSARHHASALALIDPSSPRAPAHGRTGEHHRAAFAVVDADLGQRMAV